MVTDSAGRVALVTGVPMPGHPGRYRLVLRTHSDADPWSDPVVVAPDGTRGPPAAALSPSGYLVVAWAGAHRLLSVRVRDPDGQWTTPYVTRTAMYDAPQVHVNESGDVVVAADPWSGSVRIATRRDGVWARSRVPGYGTPSVGIDDAGIVYAASATSNRGGDGWVTMSRLGVTGGWSRPTLVTGVSRKVQEADLLVSPSGALTLAVGYAGRRWVSTIDTEAYFTTSYAVLRRPSWDRPFRRLWRRDGATQLAMATTDTGRLRLTWEEWRAPGTERRSTRALVRNQQVLPRSRAAVTLAGQPETVTQGYYQLWTGLAADGSATVLWQGRPVGSRLLTPIGLARVTGDRYSSGSAWPAASGRTAT